jgi:uncharacterized DUF497 family protein
VRVLGFDWDVVNRAKLLAHEREPEDVEDVFESGDPLVFEHPRHSGRHMALGFAGERFVLVVFEYDVASRWVRVVTAYEPTSSAWWRQYAKAKSK